MREVNSVVTDRSPAFLNRTYEEAFRLVLETRRYLGERGDNDARGLAVEDALAYGVESMRLTARLTHIMAWLLAVRAYHEDELTAGELAEAEWRLGGHEICLDESTAAPDALPRALADLLSRSESLYRRIDRLDRMISGDRPAA